MKPYLYLLMALPLGLLSCRKDDCPQPEPQQQQNALDGRWRWIMSKGGMTGNMVYTPANTGTEILWIMGPGNSCRIVVDNQTVQNTTYTLGPGVSLLQNQPGLFLTVLEQFHSSGSQGQDTVLVLPMRYQFTLTADTLALAHDAYDSFGHWYVRER